jgi:hypothetical protein
VDAAVQELREGRLLLGVYLLAKAAVQHNLSSVEYQASKPGKIIADAKAQAAAKLGVSLTYVFFLLSFPFHCI